MPTSELQAWLTRAVAALLALVLLHLLRPRRRKVEVPFGGLWRRVLGSVEARSLGRRWQRLLSFLMFVAFLGLLLGAQLGDLLHPERVVRPRRQGSTVLLIDRSASMATRDGASEAGPVARLDEAKNRAAQWLDQLPPDEDVLLAVASGSFEVCAGWGSDRQAIHKALESVTASQGGMDLNRAVRSAAQMLQGRPGARLLVASDGGLPLQPLETAPVPLQWLWAGPLGAAGYDSKVPYVLANLAVEQAAIRAQADDPDRGVLTVQVRNDTGKNVRARLAIFAADTGETTGDLAKDRNLRRLVDVQLPAGATTVQVPDLELVDARFAVRVEPQHPDLIDLAHWDDWGLAVVAAQRRLKVLWVGDKNHYLDAALAATGRADVQRVAPADYHPEAWRAVDRARHGIDLVILDGVLAEAPDGLATWRLGLDLARDATQLAHNPEVLVRAADHPAMRGVSFQDTNFDAVRLLPIQSGQKVLAAASLGGGRSAAVMLASEVPVRQLTWGIDLRETDLVGRYALPILASNALAWLAGEDQPLLQPLELGRPWAVDAPLPTGSWQYREPGQPPRPARLSAGQFVGSSEAFGLHQWTHISGETVVRPTSLPPSERPTALLHQGEGVRDRPVQAVSDTGNNWPIYMAYLVVVLFGLLLEWTAYLRRRTV